MIRILIVDDQNFTRQAINAILSKESDFEVVGQAENGIKALEAIEKLRPDIAVVDLEMPQMDGFALTKKIGQHFSRTKVVILSACDDRDSINSAVKAGARGYLLKTTSGQEITDTIRYVQRGYFQLGPGLFEKLISNLIGDNSTTVESLSQLEAKSQQYFARLEKEINRKNQLTRTEMFQELDVQVSNLKEEFRQGLDTFQHRVSTQMKQGLDSLGDRFNHGSFDPNTLEEKIQARDFEQQKQLNHVLTGTRKSVSDLERKITILRYGLIFLAISFFTEKIAGFVF